MIVWKLLFSNIYILGEIITKFVQTNSQHTGLCKSMIHIQYIVHNSEVQHQNELKFQTIFFCKSTEMCHKIAC